MIKSTTSTAVQNLVEIRPWRLSVSGQMGEIYMNQYFLFVLFLSNSPTGQTARQIFTLDGSNDEDSRKGVLFAVVDIAPNLGG